jgi:ADP-heptose:LPS heptosyltransferase
MKTRLYNLLLLLLCGLYFFVRGAAKKKVSAHSAYPKTILIIQNAKLGDMVCTTPMFRAVKEKYPNARLIVCGNAVNEKLMEHQPNIDEYIVFQKSVMEMRRKFRNRKIDFACMTSPDFGALAALYLSGIPSIAAPRILNGWSPYETRLYKILRPVVWVIPHRMFHYAPREYLMLLEPIGIFAEDTRKTIVFGEKGGARADEIFASHKLQNTFCVGITPSAGNKIKEWPVERFAKVADFIIEKYNARVFVFGGGKDADLCKKMLASVKEENQGNVVLLVELSLDELKACVSELHLWISADTGPVYIAEAFNVPTVDITGPCDEKEQPPIGKFHAVVHITNRERPQLFAMNARVYDRAEARRQVEEITVEMVASAIDEICLRIGRTRVL